MRKHLPHLSRPALVFMSAIGLVAQTEHITPFTGTWKLNVAKSQFGSESAPENATITYAPDGRVTMKAVYKGKPFQLSHPWSVGAEITLGGGGEKTTVISTLRDHTLDDTFKAGGKIVSTIHSVVSPDGRTMRVANNGTDPQGRPVHTVAIYDKQ